MVNRSTAVLLVLLATTSCGDHGTANTEKPVTITWITKSACDSFFDTSRQGAQLAGQNLTAGSRTVDVEMVEPTAGCMDGGTSPGAASDAAVADSAAVADADSTGGASDAGDAGGCDTDPQSPLLQSAIDRHVAAIAIDVRNQACQGPLIDEAVAAGIKVITWDSDAPNSNRAVYYGTDNVSATRLAVGVLASLIGNSGKILMQTAMNKDQSGVYQLSSSSTYMDRVNTFNEAIVDYPGIQVVATLPCSGTNPQDHFCSQQIEAQLQASPDIKGIFFARGKILREPDLATVAPLFTGGMTQKTLHAVAFDAPPDAIGNIKAGYADFVLNQKLFAWGYDVVTLAYEMVTINQQVPSFIDSGFDAVCANNIDQFATITMTQAYLKPLDKCQYLP